MTDNKIDILKDCPDKYLKPKKKWFLSFKLLEFDANFKITRILWWSRKEDKDEKVS